MVLAVCGLTLWTVPSPAAVQVGDKAPDFSLKGVDNKDYALSDYKGKVVVINLLGWN